MESIELDIHDDTKFAMACSRISFLQQFRRVDEHGEVEEGGKTAFQEIYDLDPTDLYFLGIIAKSLKIYKENGGVF